MKEKENKKNRMGKNGLLVALLLLLGGGGYFTGGFGLLNQDGIESGSNSPNQTNTPIDIITIEESRILWNDSQVTSQELQEKISSLGESGQVKVVDKNAIKASYESVLEQLDQAKVKVIETMEQQ